MRIRTIKPEILDDEKVSHLSHAAFRLFIGVIALADDYGNLRGALDFLTGRIFHGAPADVGAALAELIEAELVRPYLVRRQAFLAVCGWAKHQKITRPAKPHIPGPLEGDDSAPLDDRWRWMTPPAVRPSPAPAEPPGPAEEGETGDAREDVHDVSAPARSDDDDDDQVSLADSAPPCEGNPPGAAAAPELPAAPEPLTAMEALRILAETAGPRLSMFPAGHPHPTTTGATKKAEEQFAAAWEPLRETWGAEHLRALGKGIGTRELWRHLRGGVSLKYLIDHLEEGLQQAAVAPVRTPVVPPPAAPERPARPAERPRPEPVKGEFRESLRALEGVVSPALMESLRVVRDDDYAQAEAG